MNAGNQKMDKHINYWDRRAGEFKSKGLVEDIPKLLEVVEKYSDSNSKLLEVGCGAGRLLEPTGAIGVDFSERMLKKNKFYPEKAYLARAENLPFEDNSFDIAFTHSCFMHIPSNKIKEAISEIQRVANIVILAEYTRGKRVLKSRDFRHNYKKLFSMKLVEEIKLSKRSILVFKNEK